MSKILLTGVDGNLGSIAADILLKLEKKENLIFVACSAKALEKYKALGIDVRVADFNIFQQEVPHVDKNCSMATSIGGG